MDPELEELEREFNEYLGKDKFDQPVVEPIVKPMVTKRKINKRKINRPPVNKPIDKELKEKRKIEMFERSQMIKNIDSGKIKFSKEEHPFFHYMQKIRLSQPDIKKTTLSYS